MVCTANDLLEWRDFPKGLKVLLLDEDSSSAAEIRSKLEEMEYIVSAFCNEDEALSAISDKPESFHIAIVEVSSYNSNGRFTFLEVAKDLPTIMTSKIQCLTTMMKCIALGAVEFLLKPLSDDKLRNIWQHVVHRAFNAEGNELSESLKPVKESMVSLLHFQLENGEQKSSISEETEHETAVEENGQGQSEESDEYQAPPTPQLKQGVRLVDDGGCQDQTNCSSEKQSGNKFGESKSVDTTCGILVAETAIEASLPQILGGAVIKEEDESPDGCKIGSNNMPLRSENKDGTNESAGDVRSPVKASGIHSSCGHKSNRKKMKVDWTPELHKKFVRAVEQLGVDQAIPSRILELMKVEGLTRHNVASHLQKYRMQRRHILPKEDVKRAPLPRDLSQRNYYPHKHVMAFPPYPSNPILPSGQVYPAWGHPPGSYLTGAQIWGHAFYPPWQPMESWHWKPYSGMHADAWGCPVMPPPPHVPCPGFPQNAAGFHSANTTHGSYCMPQNSFDLHHPEEEVIDKVVNEAISKPWLPLPLGLKPPSIDSVLTELSKQGISTIPPH
ncbi:two-component response regulator-like APRR2 [Actinidia eriantha]|uniref:two-component response regulator-like APRR2 n=1 Tax=Actinidia eriantha TaxID=165200 RepID=UPI00258B8E3E|nr:two-component response regulator-like APRR2 [Actinidia eriantha]XP_057478367.1 two-component response regulator-like APRR2 [Actinidia eriantha]XP_057478368.1 two-component response regulator-like APRR2 [Actinidia eriantha]